jgi:hypothetical protein
LEIAVEYRVPQWLSPAIKGLMDVPLRSLTDVDATRLGLKVYSIIARAKEMLEAERRLIAAFPPPLSDDTAFRSWTCADHGTCRRVWRNVWWSSIARTILHPNNPLPLEDGITCILTTPFSGMTDECKGDKVLEMTAAGGLNRTELQIVDGAIEAVRAHYGL